MAIVLGLNLGHDGAAAIIKNGRLVAAISRERLSRKKKDTGVGKAELDYVLDIAGCKLSDVDIIAFSTYNYAPDNYVKIFKLTGEEVRHNLWDHPPRVMTLDFRAGIGGRQQTAVFVQHHLAHCASAFYTSNFNEAACFSLDASAHRPEACSLFAYGIGTDVHPLYCPGLMIGNTYSLFTEKLGLGDGLFKSGTTMGLASYGKPLPIAVDNCARYGESFYERRFQPDDDRFIELMWSELSGLPPVMGLSKRESDSQRAMDIAASLQYVFEETIIKAANELHRKTASYANGNLCLSGGSFYNCNANSAILKRTPFERAALFPACGDDGTAVGAGLFVAHTLMDEKRVHYEPEEIVFLGRRYDTPPTAGRPADLDRVAAALAAGQVVGWYQGRSEFGPRALGNRSILADPRNPGIRDRINHEIKKREWFRPFAPIVLAERAAEWFDVDRESPFMLFTARVLDPDLVPAISHVDGSARLQTVTASGNAPIRDLIARFDRLTGVPMLLNTSLNIGGEPLVETPDDAIRFWQTTPVDMMVIGDRMLVRNEA
jgi:carbamoyltransferase